MIAHCLTTVRFGKSHAHSLLKTICEKSYAKQNLPNTKCKVCEQEVNEIIEKAGEMSRPLRWIYVLKKELACALANNSPTSEENTLNLLPDMVFGWE